MIKGSSQQQSLLLATPTGIQRARTSIPDNQLCHKTDFDFLAKLVETCEATSEVKAERESEGVKHLFSE